MLALPLDSETERIRPGVQIPPAACVQYCTIQDSVLSAPSILHWTEVGDWFDWALNTVDLFVGANTAFDMLVCSEQSATNDGPVKREFLRRVFDAYRDNRVTDILTRQKLLDLASGCYRGFFTDNGTWVDYQYNLKSVARRHTGFTLDKENPWRLRFGELRPLRLQVWPEEAIQYALDDVVTTGRSYLAQEDTPRDALANFPGMNPLHDQFNRVRAAFFLKLQSAWGLRTDETKVYEFASEVRKEYTEVAERLLKVGLVTRVYEKDTEKLVGYAQSKELLGHLYQPGENGAPGEIKVSKGNLLKTGDPVLQLCAEWPAIKQILAPENARQADRAHQPGNREWAEQAFKTLEQVGIASSKFAMPQAPIKQLVELVTRSLGRKVLTTKVGNIKIDGDTLEALALATQDDRLTDYSDLSTLRKTVSTDIPILLSGCRFPIHTHFEELLDTGRTSSSNPNVQNIRRKFGIRECFVPRDGNVFIDSDYAMLELHTLAQICLWLFGWSKLAETLNAGRDPHSEVAATLLGIPYEAVINAKENGTPYGNHTADEISNTRDCAKVNNFGRPGGLGNETLISYASKSYGVAISPEMAQRLKDAYFTTYPEMFDYFQYINSLESYPDSGEFNVIQPWSYRLRANASYCGACNSGFQGLGADVSCLAGFLLARACYVDPGPLFGCRPADFIHDQFLTEAPEERAHEAAMQQQAIMNAAGKEVLPDCPVKAKSLLARRWSKKAQRLVGADGRLIPWDLPKAA
jgi:hypothetical protein